MSCCNFCHVSDYWNGDSGPSFDGAATFGTPVTYLRKDWHEDRYSDHLNDLPGNSGYRGGYAYQFDIDAEPDTSGNLSFYPQGNVNNGFIYFTKDVIGWNDGRAAVHELANSLPCTVMVNYSLGAGKSRSDQNQSMQPIITVSVDGVKKFSARADMSKDALPESGSFTEDRPFFKWNQQLSSGPVPFGLIAVRNVRTFLNNFTPNSGTVSPCYSGQDLYPALSSSWPALESYTNTGFLDSNLDISSTVDSYPFGGWNIYQEVNALSTPISGWAGPTGGFPSFSYAIRGTQFNVTNYPYFEYVNFVVQRNESLGGVISDYATFTWYGSLVGNFDFTGVETQGAIDDGLSAAEINVRDTYFASGSDTLTLNYT